MGILKVYRTWLADNLKKNDGELSLELSNFLTALKVNLTRAEMDLVTNDNVNKTNEAKLTCLFLEILPGRDLGGLNIITEVLRNKSSTADLNKLIEIAEKDEYIYDESEGKFEKKTEAAKKTNDHLGKKPTSNVPDKTKKDLHQEPKPMDQEPDDPYVREIKELVDGNAKRKLINISKDFLQKLNREKVYPNFTKPKGGAVIIYNKDFQDGSDNRYGTEYDARALKKMLDEFGYEVKTERNKTAQEMKDVMNDFTKWKVHEKGHSAVVVIMTHGNVRGDGVIGVDGREISVSNFVQLLSGSRCRNLMGKPKIFIIVACRGSMEDSGTMYVRVPVEYHDGVKEDMDAVVRTGVYEDMLLAFSASPGFSSYRDLNGTMFIQKLIQVFYDNACMHHIDELLAEVRKQIGEYRLKSGYDYVTVPETRSYLTKSFYFFPNTFEQN